MREQLKLAKRNANSSTTVDTTLEEEAYQRRVKWLLRFIRAANFYRRFDDFNGHVVIRFSFHLQADSVTYDNKFLHDKANN